MQQGKQTANSSNSTESSRYDEYPVAAVLSPPMTNGTGRTTGQESFLLMALKNSCNWSYGAQIKTGNPLRSLLYYSTFTLSSQLTVHATLKL